MKKRFHFVPKLATELTLMTSAVRHVAAFCASVACLRCNGVSAVMHRYAARPSIANGAVAGASSTPTIERIACLLSTSFAHRGCFFETITAVATTSNQSSHY